MSCFSTLTKSAFVLRTGKPRGTTIDRSKSSHMYHKAREHYKRAVKKHHEYILKRYQEDEWYRQNLELQDITEEKVKECDRIAAGPNREHVATAAERERRSNTYYLKPTTAGGASTIAIPICRKGKIGIGNRFVDKETVLPRNQRTPTGSGNIGAVDKVGLSQAQQLTRWD